MNGFIGSWVWMLSVSWVWGWEGTVIAGVVSYNNNIYLLQLGCHPVAVVILHVNKT